MDVERETLTPQEYQAANRIARLMRAARKRSGLTQIEVSGKLGISQSALSKVENGILIPSAPQWFDFCELTGITADSLVLGFIEEHRPAVVEDGKQDLGFKLHPRYAYSRGSKVRAMQPFIGFFQTVLGQEKFEAYLKSMKTDPDFFVDLDNQINLNFCMDMARYLITEGHLKPKDFTRLVKSVSQGQSHGSLRQHYDSADSVANRFRLLISNSRHYECNFEYTLEDSRKNLVEIAVKPEKHLKDFTYKSDEDLGDFLCKYKQKYFERFTVYGDGASRPGLLTEKECHYHGAERCVYQIKLTA